MESISFFFWALVLKNAANGVRERRNESGRYDINLINAL